MTQRGMRGASSMHVIDNLTIDQIGALQGVHCH